MSQPIPYYRSLMVAILIQHYRKDIKGCGCGWSELGRSHPEHVMDMYERAIVDGRR